MNAILIALVITFLIVALSQAYLQLAVQLPLFVVWCCYNNKRAKRHTNSLHGASHSRLALEDAAKLDAERASDVVAWEQGLYDSGFWWAPVCIPEGRLASEVDSDAPAKDQLDVLEGWLDRQKPQGAVPLTVRVTARRTPSSYRSSSRSCSSPSPPPPSPGNT